MMMTTTIKVMTTTTAMINQNNNAMTTTLTTTTITTTTMMMTWWWWWRQTAFRGKWSRSLRASLFVVGRNNWQAVASSLKLRKLTTREELINRGNVGGGGGGGEKVIKNFTKTTGQEYNYRDWIRTKLNYRGTQTGRSLDKVLLLQSTARSLRNPKIN